MDRQTKMEKNKLYKIILFCLCVVLVCLQVVCFSLGFFVELNAIIDIVALVVSFVVVVVLKKKQGIGKTKEEIYIASNRIGICLLYHCIYSIRDINI